MKYLITIFATAFFFAGCNSNQDQEPQPETGTTIVEADTATERSENAFPDETIAFITETGFSKYAKSKLAKFDWNEFGVTRFWKEEFLRKTPFTPDPDYFDTYGRFLKYSPDSSKFIDLDSYNIVIRKDKKGRLIGTDQGPDTEVSLVDVKKKQKMRLLFLGPGNGVEDAGWIDNDNLVLMGFQENANATRTNAVVWKFNLPSGMVYLYELEDDNAVNNLKDYSQKERLKDVRME